MAQNIRGAANGERYAVVVSVVVVVRLPVYFAFGGPLVEDKNSSSNHIDVAPRWCRFRPSKVHKHKS